MMILARSNSASPRAAACRRTKRCCCIARRRPTGLAAWRTTVRRRKHPEPVVTYIIDRNVNYTNVCVARCNFCAFYREVGHGDGYVLGFEEIFRKIEETRALGGVQLLLQGGHNPDLPIAWYEDLFRAVKQKFPDFKLHALSPPEVLHISRMGEAAGSRSDRSPDRGRARQRSRRRRRDPRRSRAQAAQLLQQGERRRMARRDAPRAPGRPAHHRDDDVRDGRDRRRAARAHAAAARAAGRDRRLHRVHHLELPAGSHRARRASKPPASSTCARWRSRGWCSTTSTTCRRRG